MAKKTKGKKKLLLAVVALVLVCAIGVGIFFLAKGGSEPVKVVSFQFIGMTEYWGDSQESYGPVSTDKIQTVFLTDTQTVTEVKVQPGDTVKKGDVLLTFDTTLDSLSLERKRLEVEKVKVQIQAAADQLEKVYEMIPYEPPRFDETEEEIDLGKELKETPYEISTDTVYDGSTMEKALICWMQQDVPISDEVLRALYDTALTYQLKNAEQKASSASDTPEQPAQPEQPPVDEQPKADPPKEEPPKTEDTPTPVTPPVPQPIADEDITEEPAPPPTLTLDFYCEDGDGEEKEKAWSTTVTMDQSEYVIPDFFARDTVKTYWFESAKRISDGLELENMTIPVCPEDETERTAWESRWGAGVELTYVRKVETSAKQLKDGKLTELKDGFPVKLEVDKDAVLLISSSLKDVEREVTTTFTVTPANGILQHSQEGNTLVLAGKPEELTTAPISYTVKAVHHFEGTNWDVAEEFTFDLSVVTEPVVKKGEFYAVIKVTEDNFLRGMPTTWQGVKVYVYEDGFGMELFDASMLQDHTLPPEEEIEIELPVIDPEHTYSAEQIEDMKKQLNKTIQEQKVKLKMAEAEYKIMEQELGDGNIYASIDGEVITVLTEEEAEETKQPMVKVSGGGGFYIEGAVSELEKDNLKIGQEVTINDWNSGQTYTGEVKSIGDFPSTGNGWNGMGNPNATYYPFRVFIDGSADLQAGNYVNMTYSTSSAEHGVYLESPFILTEQGNSYVYARGADGKLEKRPVVVGKSLWGTYKEILSGVTEEDFLAFPYGKDIKEGAPTVESDISALYGY